LSRSGGLLPCLHRFVTESTRSFDTLSRVKARVLIVDDEPDVLDLLAFKLAASGFEVLSASTGLEALRRARCDSPALIVLDLLLPDLDGLSVCEILRSQPSTRELPIIFFSACGPPANLPRSARLHLSHWLTKDAGFDALRDSIRRALAEAGQQEWAAWGSED
jgi:CheY-like chemotaxis protein